MKGISSEKFGVTKNGEQASLYTITNSNQMSVSVTDFGATMTSLKVPNQKGELLDVVLGYDHLSEYETEGGYFGMVVGRCANRIADGSFTLNDKVYPLVQNNGKNHLHGGNVGFSHRIWQVEEQQQTLVLRLFSPDMEEGYPGNMQVQVSYTLTDQNQLEISYEAQADQDTICNLTNHSYFNLKGHQGGSIEDHQLQIFADAYLPVDEGSIPTGEYRAVVDTPFDFTTSKTIGTDIPETGYDHNYVLNSGDEKLRTAAVLSSPDGSLQMSCLTTQPGVQLYTGNYISPRVGKGGVSYTARDGVCLETQAFPDAVNQKKFPTVVLKANEQYRERTIFQFDVKNNSKSV